jgi:hypothetical protein
VAAVEFALSGVLLMLFIFGIVNLGMLGFSIAALNHGVQQAARSAAVKAAANFVSTGTYTCPSTTDIEGYFDTYADPPFPSSKPITTPNYIASPVSLTAAWTNNGTGTTGLQDLYITLTVTYKWRPIGIPVFPNGIPLQATTVATVLGTNGVNVSSTTCAGS